MDRRWDSVDPWRGGGIQGSIGEGGGRWSDPRIDRRDRGLMRAEKSRRRGRDPETDHGGVCTGAHVRAHTHACACTHIHTQPRSPGRTGLTSSQTLIPAHTRTVAHMYTRMHAHACAFTRPCPHTHTHTSFLSYSLQPGPRVCMCACVRGVTGVSLCACVYVSVCTCVLGGSRGCVCVNGRVCVYMCVLQGVAVVCVCVWQGVCTCAPPHTIHSPSFHSCLPLPRACAPPPPRPRSVVFFMNGPLTSMGPPHVTPPRGHKRFCRRRCPGCCSRSEPPPRVSERPGSVGWGRKSGGGGWEGGTGGT